MRPSASVCRWLLVLLFVLLAAVRVSAADSLDSARKLYAAAAYEEALAMLDRLSGESEAPAPEVEQQRALCLLALNRPEEAERSIAVVIQANPMYVPDASSVSPRIRTAFEEVRSRLMPAIARKQFAVARQSFEAAEYARAAVEFDAVLALTADAAPAEGGLGDLRLLADGFRSLALARLAPPPQAEEPRTAEGVAVDHVLDATAPGVEPPAVVKQDIPAWRPSMGAPPAAEGLVAITIDENGDVSKVDIIRSLHPEYDRLLLAAARKWTYVPATHNGTRVKFRKLLRLALR